MNYFLTTNRLAVDAFQLLKTYCEAHNFAGAISRKRGKIIIVGAVPTGFDREPHFYKNELELKMSCSYGPGRYDPLYEEKGTDYPIGICQMD